MRQDSDDYEIQRKWRAISMREEKKYDAEILALEKKLFRHKYYSEKVVPRDTNYPLVANKGQGEGLDLSVPISGEQLQKYLDDNNVYAGPLNEAKWGRNSVHYWRNVNGDNTIATSDLMEPEIGY